MQLGFTYSTQFLQWMRWGSSSQRFDLQPGVELVRFGMG